MILIIVIFNNFENTYFYIFKTIENISNFFPNFFETFFIANFNIKLIHQQVRIFENAIQKLNKKISKICYHFFTANYLIRVKEY